MTSLRDSAYTPGIRRVVQLQIFTALVAVVTAAQGLKAFTITLLSPMFLPFPSPRSLTSGPICLLLKHL
ncbi:hypothetical protein LY76DRAFT_589435 [Colletotrichum caudatum]|nr:hypothetical protein LY76DRAFT_589435 [Colletotrichum caudatum]